MCSFLVTVMTVDDAAEGINLSLILLQLSPQTSILNSLPLLTEDFKGT